VIPLIRRRVISSLAEYIANEYFPTSEILPERIADDNQISYCYGFYGNSFDGLLEHQYGDFHIFINLTKVKTPKSNRSRFTFGHELGHYFLDEHRLALESGQTPSHPSITDFSTKNPVEQEADYFSCSLLMPETRFKADCYRKLVSMELIHSLSNKYQVSLAATLLRYSHIGNHPVVVICSQNSQIRWHWKSDDFEFKYLKGVNGRVPLNTVTGDYFYNKKKYNYPEQIFAESWFEYLDFPPDTYSLTEQCFYFDGVNTVLTMIW